MTPTRLVTALPASVAPTRSVPARAGRSLLARLLMVTLLPVLLVGAAVAALLGVQRMTALRAIDESLAGTVARILATTLDVRDLSQVTAQLQAAVTAPDVAFIDVQPVGGELRYFRSRTPENDWALRPAYDAQLLARPYDHRFVYGGELRTLTLAAARAAPPAVRARLERQARQAAAPQVIQLVQASVYQDRSGVRALRLPGEAAPPGAHIFDLGVGVSNAEIDALLGRQQWLAAAAGTLSVLLGVTLAWRATRRIVRPIVALTRAADRLSLGDLDGPLTLPTPHHTITELHELAQAIERLRTSLGLALSRLRPHPAQPPAVRTAPLTGEHPHGRA